MSNIYLDAHPSDPERALTDCLDAYHQLFNNPFEEYEQGGEELEMWFGELTALVCDGPPYDPFHSTEEIMKHLLNRPEWDNQTLDRWLIRLYECLWLDDPARQKHIKSGRILRVNHDEEDD